MLAKILDWLIGNICYHKYSLIKEQKIYNLDGRHTKDEYVLQCSKCGKIISYKI